MEARGVAEAVVRFVRLHKVDDVEFPRKGWTFKDDGRKSGTHPELSDRPGVYLFCDPRQESPATPFEQSVAEIWYIGKSQRETASRIWAHVGRTRDRLTGAPWPPFTDFKWQSRSNVGADVMQSIKDGSVLVYSIAIASAEFYMAAAIEAFLLHEVRSLDGRIPLFNRKNG